MSAILNEQNSIVQLRIPPNSVEAEQSVIGGLLLNNDAFDDIRGIVKEHDFYRQDHRLIFRSMVTVLETDGQFDIMTLSQWLKDCDELENAGGLAYLGTLAKDTPSAANIVNYAKIVAKKSQYRTLISLGSELSEDAFNEDQNPSEIIQQAGNGFDDVLENQCGESVSMFDLHSDTMDMIQENIKTREEKGLTGVPCGLDTVDNLLGGWQKSRLYVIGARPGMGKTAFANQSAIFAAMNGYPAGIINLEMPRKELVLRMLSNFYQVNGTALSFGNKHEHARLQIAIQKAKDNQKPLLENAQLFVEKNLTTIDAISAKITQWVRKNKIKLAVIDYLQLVKATGESRTIAVGNISRELKLLANRLEIPIIVLSQLSRECEKQARKPEPSDLRDSGSIEQDADCIIFLHSDKSLVFDTHKQIEIGLSKVRYGSPGWIEGYAGKAPFTFEGRTQTFREADGDMYSNRYA